ncbi:hypothetical protein ACH5RR_018161 [Cinchona calisaya]|uniref:Uncharacterized protein n=1 Tax=Cinchona calisaya TaxID=153742 RepID=A0ABD2ZNJ4_9GENT
MYRNSVGYLLYDSSIGNWDDVMDKTCFESHMSSRIELSSLITPKARVKEIVIKKPNFVLVIVKPITKTKPWKDVLMSPSAPIAYHTVQVVDQQFPALNASFIKRARVGNKARPSGYAKTVPLFKEVFYFKSAITMGRNP